MNFSIIFLLSQTNPYKDQMSKKLKRISKKIQPKYLNMNIKIPFFFLLNILKFLDAPL